MLDSSSRLPCHPATAPRDWPRDCWEEATFTRPMRSPFAVETVPDVDVRLEEAALFEPPRPRASPPPRRSTAPARMDEETTSRSTVEPAFLRALREVCDSAGLIKAAIDLGKTVEEPAFKAEALVETSSVRRTR